MGKGGGSSKPQTQYVKTETSNLPEYAKPYYQDMMASAQGLTMGSTYQPYGGQRIADFTPAQQQTMQNVLNQGTPNEFNAAAGLAQTAGLGSLQAGQYTPGQFNAQQIGLPNLQNYSMATPDQFGQVQAQQYMNPYQQSVIDIQKNEAARDAKKSQLVGDLGAAAQGTYGGSRQLLAGMERERQLGQNLADIQQKGSQQAYENAQQQFERDRAALQNAQGQNLNSYLQTQQLGTQSGLQALMANQQYNMEAQKAAEQSRQFGSQQGLAGYNQMGNLAQTLGNLGQMRSQTDQSRLNQQLGIGAMDQALQQQALDTQYQDYLRQQGYPLEMLQQYSSLLRGVPVTPSTQTSYQTPTPSVASQLLSTGVGALGVSNALKS